MLAPLFRVIAALTLPHMVVTAWLETQPAGQTRRERALQAAPPRRRNGMHRRLGRTPDRLVPHAAAGTGRFATGHRPQPGVRSLPRTAVAAWHIDRSGALCWRPLGSTPPVRLAMTDRGNTGWGQFSSSLSQ